MHIIFIRSNGLTWTCGEQSKKKIPARTTIVDLCSMLNVTSKNLSFKGGKGPVSLGNKSRGGVTSGPYFESNVASTQAQF